MRTFVSILTLTVPLVTTCVADPLKREDVAADAKWVLHLDVDKLRSTTVGDYLIKQVSDTKLAPLMRQFDFELDWNKVNSLTAYGSGFQSKSMFNGIVLIKTDLDLRKPLDNAVARITQGDSNKTDSLGKTQEGSVTMYSLKDHLFVALQPGKPAIVGKSLDSVQQAGDVLSGKSANLASTKTFSEFPKSQKSFFFLGAVEAFDPTGELGESTHDADGLNPKAKILKLADGGRVVLGEESHELILDLSLKAKSTEVVTQMQQVIQGMIALASLSQPDNQDLQQLAQSAKVSSTGKIVSLKLGYPADQAIQMLTTHINRQLEHKANAENGQDPDTKPAPKHKHKKHEKQEQQEPAKTDDQ